MRPYIYTDKLEEELKNLDIRDNDNVSNIMVIERRDRRYKKTLVRQSMAYMEAYNRLKPHTTKLSGKNNAP